MRAVHVWIAAGVLLVGSYLSLGIGAASSVGVADLFPPTADEWHILATSRIPRLMAILMAGASLSVAGLIMQRITANRFVSPSTSGTVEAAVLGILIATMLFSSTSLVVKMLIAIVTAIAGTMVFLQMLQRIQHREGIVVALVGLMYGGVLAAITTFVAYQRDMVQYLDIWTTGSFSGILEGRYEPLYIVLLVGVIGYLFADRFTVIGMGESFATNLGLNYQRILYIGLVVVSVMAAVVVVVVGAIPFLGLIVPNVVTLLLGDNVKKVLPLTALAGAGFVLACDVVGRTAIYPYELPVATIAGGIGGVVFIWLIMRSAKGASV
ncbi:iron chelate uptake ABC transporter family permease subunit [Ornithinimicrobium sp. F0845]|uniref:ABC transporter permease n=1 Tax=Ornithinimicrobium sp. F0845 TaxID=2926412 RepID=UPI001FF2CC6E|nr:iron chelate uptake ABC transporter family permease subunit [Ornithinimicrobium sp. F0845]